MATRDPSQSSLSGQLLVAMPQMLDPRFARTVVYLCAHSPEGAMGLVVNRLIDSLNFESLLTQLGVEATGAAADMAVHFGGPVESSRGFVLHTSDYHQDSTLVIDDEIALTATVDVLGAMPVGALSGFSNPDVCVASCARVISCAFAVFSTGGVPNVGM